MNAINSYIEQFVEHDNEKLSHILKGQSQRMDIQPSGLHKH